MVLAAVCYDTAHCNTAHYSTAHYNTTHYNTAHYNSVMCQNSKCMYRDSLVIFYYVDSEELT